MDWRYSASDAGNSRESLQEQSVQGSTQGQSANEGKKVDRIGKDSGKSVTIISPQYRGGRLLEPAFSLSYNFRPSRHGQSFFSRCFGLSDGWSGLAWRAAETFNIDDLKNENGVTILLDHLESELEQ